VDHGCARNLAAARPVFPGITLFYAGHALGHVIEILRRKVVN